MRISPDKPIPERLDLLDGYLRDRESRFSTIQANCEKKIVWNAGRKAKTRLAIVYIHGFSASRMEIWPLCDRLAEALGANLFYTRLGGHGQDGPAMGEARVSDWLADGREAVTIGSRIGHRVILVGTSTGGTLATWPAPFFPRKPPTACWPPFWTFSTTAHRLDDAPSVTKSL